MCDSKSDINFILNNRINTIEYILENKNSIIKDIKIKKTQIPTHPPYEYHNEERIYQYYECKDIDFIENCQFLEFIMRNNCMNSDILKWVVKMFKHFNFDRTHVAFRLLAIDYFIKYFHYRPLQSHNEKDVIEMMVNIFLDYSNRVLCRCYDIQMLLNQEMFVKVLFNFLDGRRFEKWFMDHYKTDRDLLEWKFSIINDFAKDYCGLEITMQDCIEYINGRSKYYTNRLTIN
ncbi:hypothetical protein DICPUDRAFT_74408 [Dictyostelium purpureum]|uniref:Uncharacterized protein n=1 Tax=Dictyostelium purpureum TaxID=5786 RepID=F0Z7N1_DICPU|nr:uncharacterized protein DICPUDRAFT_74408 [Dictyostelium purpureum]EGC40093.1 hypothetical protein DICPUDRAFT_74408 [Dictyostelium purpureum]|eukprot:XP_003283442.1 hypothetical protein DICPUDRAFT_74408 [Dictyostelium purpureum]